MAPAGVVPTFDPFEDRCRQLHARIPVLAVEEFALHRGPERFDERVVDAGGDSTHGSEQASGTEPVSEYPGRVSHAPVGMHDGSAG